MRARSADLFGLEPDQVTEVRLAGLFGVDAALRAFELEAGRGTTELAIVLSHQKCRVLGSVPRPLLRACRTARDAVVFSEFSGDRPPAGGPIVARERALAVASVIARRVPVPTFAAVLRDPTPYVSFVSSS